MKKKEGSALLILIIGFSILLTITLISSAQINLKKGQVYKAKISNALKASNLACAVPDIHEYGTTHNIIVKDEGEALNRFKDSLKINLKLNDSLVGSDKSFIVGEVIIDKFVIYNVYGNDVEVISYSSGSFTKIMHLGSKGNIKTPNDEIINTTTIFSQIKFGIKIFNQELKDLYEHNTVDISNE